MLKIKKNVRYYYLIGLFNALLKIEIKIKGQIWWLNSFINNFSFHSIENVLRNKFNKKLKRIGNIRLNLVNYF